MDVEKISTKKKITWYFSIMFSLLLLVGTSYAFFMYSKVGEKQNDLATGIFQVTFQEESGAIYLKNTYPMKDEEGQNLDSFNFSVENKGDIAAKYQISIVEDESNTLNRSSLKYELKKQGEEGTISNLNDLVIKDNVSLDGLQKDTYELRIWLDENTGNEAMGKTWKGKVQVVAEESKAYAFEDYIAPTIKLSGDKVMTVKKGEEFTDPGIESVSDNVDSLTKEQVTKRYEYFDGIKNQEATEVDTNREGVYIIYYELLDSRGNKGVAARTVNVVQVNSTPPVVTLNGEQEVNLYVGESYTDEGASATDELGTELPVLTFGSYNTKSFGDYIIKYFAIDKNGNIGSNTRTIHVTIYEDPVGANRPELTDGLIPVYYDEDNQVWRKANRYGKWYSYGEQWWGNAVTLDQSIVRDVSGKNNHATYDQGVQSNGDTITLDGVNDYIDLGLENVEFGKTFSAVVRFKIESMPSSELGFIIGNAENAGMMIRFRTTDKKIVYYVHNGTGYQVKVSNNTLDIGTWYEMALVFNGNKTIVYVNGEVFDTITYTSTFDMLKSPQPIAIGANPNNTTVHSEFMNITYSKAEIYKQVLTEQQVKDMYAGKELSDKSKLVVQLNIDDFKETKRPKDYITTDGINDGIDLGLENVDFGQTITMITRFRIEQFPEDINKVAFILGNAESAGFMIRLRQDKKIAYYVYDGTQYQYKLSDKTLEAGVWYELAFVFNGNSAIIYIDGEKFDSINYASTFNMKVSPESIFLGSNPSKGFSCNEFANISYSKAQVYKQVLTEQQVKDIYNGNELSDKTNLLVDLDFGVGEAIENDTALPMESINTMWTWIPRYEYDYVNIANYAGGTQEEPGAIGVNFLNNTSQSNGGNYMLHPAFKFGNEELKGFWSGKFELSNMERQNITDSSNLTPQIKPNVYSWRKVQIANAFTVSQKMTNEYKNRYGLTGTEDTHISKNSEWGAIAYLSQSAYGKYGNENYQGTEKEVYTNNCSNYITGIAGDAVDSGPSATCNNTYETPQGQKASTTGNIYGNYDMSGGAWEYVMGILVDDKGLPRSGTDATTNSGFNGTLGDGTTFSKGIDFPKELKYYDLYSATDITSGSSDLTKTACEGKVCYGHALSETAGWYGDWEVFVTAKNPWFVRGGWENDVTIGLFSFSWNGGGIGITSYRLILIP